MVAHHRSDAARGFCSKSHDLCGKGSGMEPAMGKETEMRGSMAAATVVVHPPPDLPTMITCKRVLQASRDRAEMEPRSRLVVHDPKRRAEQQRGREGAAHEAARHADGSRQQLGAEKAHPCN